MKKFIQMIILLLYEWNCPMRLFSLRPIRNFQWWSLRLTWGFDHNNYSHVYYPIILWILQPVSDMTSIKIILLTSNQIFQIMTLSADWNLLKLFLYIYPLKNLLTDIIQAFIILLSFIILDYSYYFWHDDILWMT